MSDYDMDNTQRMLDPCNPMDFLYYTLRRDWLASCVKLRCDVAA